MLYDGGFISLQTRFLWTRTKTGYISFKHRVIIRKITSEPSHVIDVIPETVGKSLQKDQYNVGIILQTSLARIYHIPYLSGLIKWYILCSQCSLHIPWFGHKKHISPPVQ